MNTVVYLLLLIATVNGAWKGGLRVTWGYGSNLGTDYYIDMPKTTEQAQTMGWDSVEKPDGLPYPFLDMYCSDDRIICVFCDNTNYTVGLQVGIPVDDVENAIMDWDYLGYTSWDTEVDGVVKQFHTIQQYYASEETFARSASERLNNWNQNKTIQEDVWVTSYNRTLLRIPTTTEEIVNSDFTKQGCMVTMGHHYYYKLNTESDCLTGVIAWFPLVDPVSGELIAIGYTGAYTLARTHKWFEFTTKSILESNVPNAPKCLHEMADFPGVVTLHIFYVDNPWDITCPEA